MASKYPDQPVDIESGEFVRIKSNDNAVTSEKPLPTHDHLTDYVLQELRIMNVQLAFMTNNQVDQTDIEVTP